MNAPVNPTTFLAVTPKLRRHIEKTVEELLALLDALDGEPDLEDEGSSEPVLGAAEGGIHVPQSAWSQGRSHRPATDECEDDACDLEAGADDEPDVDDEPDEDDEPGGDDEPDVDDEDDEPDVDGGGGGDAWFAWLDTLERDALLPVAAGEGSRHG